MSSNNKLHTSGKMNTKVRITSKFSETKQEYEINPIQRLKSKFSETHNRNTKLIQYNV